MPSPNFRRRYQISQDGSADLPMVEISWNALAAVNDPDVMEQIATIAVGESTVLGMCDPITRLPDAEGSMSTYSVSTLGTGPWASGLSWEDALRSLDEAQRVLGYDGRTGFGPVITVDDPGAEAAAFEGLAAEFDAVARQIVDLELARRAAAPAPRGWTQDPNAAAPIPTGVVGVAHKNAQEFARQFRLVARCVRSGDYGPTNARVCRESRDLAHAIKWSAANGFQLVVTPGTRVRTVGTAAKDADTGTFHGLADNGQALVGWDSGTRSAIPFAMIQAAAT